MSIVTKSFKKIGKSWTGLDRKYQALLVLVALVLASYFAAQSTIYGGGWEVRNGIKAVTVNGKTYTIGGAKPLAAPVWGDKNLRFDVDAATTGVPDIQVVLGPPREKIFTSDGWVNAPSGQSFKEIRKSVGDTVYFFSQKVFFYELSIIVVPQVQSATYWPVVSGEASGMNNAKNAKINLQLSFETDPWANKLVDEIEGKTGSYLLDEDKVWTGVMSAQCIDVEPKFVGWSGTSKPPNGLIDPYQVENALINMQTDEGVFTGQTGTFTESSMPTQHPNNIAPSTILLTVGGEMAPAYTWNLFESVALYPAQLKYRIRVDVLTEAGYDLEEGDMDDDLGDFEFLQGVFVAIGPLIDFLRSPEGIIFMVVIAIVLAVAFKIYVKIQTGGLVG